MAEQKLEFFEGEQGVQAINLVNDDGTAYDLDANGGTTTLLIYVHDVDEKDDVQNIVDGDTLTVVVAASGTTTWAFDFTGMTVQWVKAEWVVYRVSTDGTIRRFSKPQPFVMRRNKYRAP